MNPLPYRRRGLVERRREWSRRLVELDGFSARAVELTPAPRRRVGPHDGTAIESDRFRVEAAPDGTLTVLDKRTGRRFEHLHRLEDEPDMGDLYNFCPVDGADTWRSERRDVGCSATARRPRARAGSRPAACWARHGRAAPLTVTTVVRLIEGIRRVEFRTTIDNATPTITGYASCSRSRPGRRRTVRAEGQFALVHRPLVPPAADGPNGSSRRTRRSTRSARSRSGQLALLTKGLPEYEARPATAAPSCA